MEQLITIMNVIIGWIPEMLAVVGAFALIAARTPNKSDDRIIQVILDVINFLGSNFGSAKNDPAK